MRRSVPPSTVGLVVWTLLGVTACAPFKVHTIAEPDTGLAAARTYAWTSGMKEAIDESTTPSLVRQVIEAELRKKGYQSDESNPDFRISYRFQSQLQVTGREARQYHAQDSGWFPSIGGDVYLDEHRTGQLRIIVYEPSGKRQIWQGFATGRLAAEYSPKEREEVLRRAVQAVLKRFPPK
jgi:hypothetical protein